MKRLLLILLLVLFAAKAKAQIGFRGGISQTSDYFSSLFQDGRTGFHLGGFHQFNFNKWLRFRSELQYNQKGYKIRDRIAENTIHINYDFLNVNFLGELIIGDNIFFQAGISCNYQLDINAKYNSAPAIIINHPENSFHVAPVAGLCKRIGKNFGSSVRFSHSILSINDNSNHVLISFSLEYYL